jgi:hypothetical protein
VDFSSYSNGLRISDYVTSSKQVALLPKLSGVTKFYVKIDLEKLGN